jgi:DNA-binding FrmR family transcriptional regulator
MSCVTGAVKRLDISRTHTKTGVTCDRSHETFTYLRHILKQVSCVTGAMKRLDISLTHTKTGVKCYRSHETFRYLTDTY